jgi:50S ribosome-binding GTPase
MRTSHMCQSLLVSDDELPRREAGCRSVLQMQYPSTAELAPGVTRDRLYTRANWGNREFVLVDTGGLMSEAAKLPEAQQSAAMREISDRELPQVGAAGFVASQGCGRSINLISATAALHMVQSVRLITLVE